MDRTRSIELCRFPEALKSSFDINYVQCSTYRVGTLHYEPSLNFQPGKKSPAPTQRAEYEITFCAQGGRGSNIFPTDLRTGFFPIINLMAGLLRAMRNSLILRGNLKILMDLILMSEFSNQIISISTDFEAKMIQNAQCKL